MCKPSRLEVDQHELYKVWSKISLSPKTITSSILTKFPFEFLCMNSFLCCCSVFGLIPVCICNFQLPCGPQACAEGKHHLMSWSNFHFENHHCRHADITFFSPKLCRCCNFSHRLRVSMQSCTAISWSVKGGRPLETASANIQSCTC